MVAESSVLNWVNTFDLEDPVATLEELADGVVLHRILREIAPAHFPDGALKDNCGSNAILRTTNIKKLLRALEGYYRDVLLQDLHSGYVDPEQVAQADATEVSKLVELVLGCAVQCDDKQRYIQRLMKDLDKQSQADIMVLSRLLAPRATRMAASPYAVVPCLHECVGVRLQAKSADPPGTCGCFCARAPPAHLPANPCAHTGAHEAVPEPRRTAGNRPTRGGAGLDARQRGRVAGGRAAGSAAQTADTGGGPRGKQGGVAGPACHSA